MRDPARRAELVAEADAERQVLDPASVFVLAGADARYDCTPGDSLAAHAPNAGRAPAEAFIDLSLETDGVAAFNFPFLNQSLDAVEEMLGDPTVVIGLADAGAHVGQIMDASQPTFFLTYWVRERGRCSHRGGGAPADLRHRDALRRARPRRVAARRVRRRQRASTSSGLRLPLPEYVHDFPGGAGRYVQRADGYDTTIVNGRGVHGARRAHRRASPAACCARPTERESP